MYIVKDCRHMNVHSWKNNICLKQLKQRRFRRYLTEQIMRDRLYLRSKCGSSNSTSTSRTSLQKGDPWKQRINISSKSLEVNNTATLYHACTLVLSSQSIPENATKKLIMNPNPNIKHHLIVYKPHMPIFQVVSAAVLMEHKNSPE